MKSAEYALERCTATIIKGNAEDMAMHGVPRAEYSKFCIEKCV